MNWKEELITLLNRKGLDHLPTENIYEDIQDFIQSLLDEKDKHYQTEIEKIVCKHKEQCGEELGQNAEEIIEDLTKLIKK